MTAWVRAIRYQLPPRYGVILSRALNLNKSSSLLWIGISPGLPLAGS